MKTIKVDGMSCQHCSSSVEKAVSKIEGIKNVNVSLENKEVSFDEDGNVDIDEVKNTINKIGFVAGEVK